jgi:hypothetical protein
VAVESASFLGVPVSMNTGSGLYLNSKSRPCPLSFLQITVLNRKEKQDWLSCSQAPHNTPQWEAWGSQSAKSSNRAHRAARMTKSGGMFMSDFDTSRMFGDGLDSGATKIVRRWRGIARCDAD